LAGVRQGVGGEATVFQRWVLKKGTMLALTPNPSPARG